MTDVNQPVSSLQQQSLLAYYIGILQRRIWIVLSLVIIGTTLGLIRGVRRPRVYMATARVLVEQQGPSVMQFDGRNSEGVRWDDSYYQTQTHLVKSRDVLDIALSDPKINALVQREADFARTSLLEELRQSLLAMLGADPAPLENTWERLRERVQARHVRDTHFVDISVVSRKPLSTYVLANRVAQAFETYHRKIVEASLGDAFVKLEREKNEQERELQKAEMELQSFRESAKGVAVSSSGGEPKPAIERLNSLNRKLTDVQLQCIELESQIEVMEKALQSDALQDEATSRTLFALPVIKADQALSEAQQALTDAQEDRAMLSQTYGAAHPLLQAADSRCEVLLEQFRTALKDVVEAERNRLNMLNNEEDELSRQYAAQKTSALQLAREDFQLTRLQNAVDRHRRLYDALVERMREVDVSSGLLQTDVRLVDRARPPEKPISPGVKRTVLLSMIISLLLGVGLAFVFENLDDTVKTPEDLKERLTVPLLGFVPSILTDDDPGLPGAELDNSSFLKGMVQSVKTMVRDRLILMRPDWFNTPQQAPTEAQQRERFRRGMMVVNEPVSSVAEAYRGIRTSLFYSVPADTVRTLAITSCRPQEGKTTTCCNLALSIAQTGKRVMLIDGDLHRPMLHRTLGVERREGLTSILVGECGWRDAISRVNVNTETGQFLDVITAGPISPNPSELLGSARMREFVEEMQKDYDWVIIDTPPILFVSDASVMSVLCDGVIVVVKSGSSTRTLLQRAREQLDSVEANILGTILNNVLVSRMGRHASTYYNYGYSRYAKDYKSLYYASSDVEDEATAAAPATSGADEPQAKAASAATGSTPRPTKTEVRAEGDQADSGSGATAALEALSGLNEYDVGDRSKTRYERQIRKALQLSHAGHDERAYELIDSLMKLTPHDIAVREAMVNVTLNSGKTDEAETLAKALLDDDPVNAYALYVCGSMRIVQGDQKEAKSLLRKSVTHDPQPEALNNLAWVLSEEGDQDAAEPYIRQALELNASMHQAWDTLGLILLRQGQEEEAGTAFGKALKLDRYDICATLNMAEIHVRQGDPRKAFKLLARIQGRRKEMRETERKRYKALVDETMNA